MNAHVLSRNNAVETRKSLAKVAKKAKEEARAGLLGQFTDYFFAAHCFFNPARYSTKSTSSCVVMVICKPVGMIEIFICCIEVISPRL